MSNAAEVKAMRAAGYSPPDGFGRSVENERRINAAVCATFDTTDGREVLAWLHQITTLRALPDTAPEAQLRALNAQRNLVAIIIERIEHGRHGRPGSSTSGE